jgi:hypothetical protein
MAALLDIRKDVFQTELYHVLMIMVIRRVTIKGFALACKRFAVKIRAEQDFKSMLVLLIKSSRFLIKILTQRLRT